MFATIPDLGLSSGFRGDSTIAKPLKRATFGTGIADSAPDREPRSPLSAMTPNRSPRQCLYVEYTRQALGSAMPIGELMWHMDRDELCFLSGGGGWSH